MALRYALQLGGSYRFGVYAEHINLMICCGDMLIYLALELLRFASKGELPEFGYCNAMLVFLVVNMLFSVRIRLVIACWRPLLASCLPLPSSGFAASSHSSMT